MADRVLNNRFIVNILTSSNKRKKKGITESRNSLLKKIRINCTHKNRNTSNNPKRHNGHKF